jgi:hypothetical protein
VAVPLEVVLVDLLKVLDRGWIARSSPFLSVASPLRRKGHDLLPDVLSVWGRRIADQC